MRAQFLLCRSRIFHGFGENSLVKCIISKSILALHESIYRISSISPTPPPQCMKTTSFESQCLSWFKFSSLVHSVTGQRSHVHEHWDVEGNDKQFLLTCNASPKMAFLVLHYQRKILFLSVLKHCLALRPKIEKFCVFGIACW